MTTALTIITVGTSSIPKFINAITGTGGDISREQALQRKCADVTAKIQRRYCKKYVRRTAANNREPADPPVLKRFRSSSTGSGPWRNTTCNQEQCTLSYEDGEVLYKSAQGGDTFSISTVVTYKGSEYDCIKQGLTPQTCPVQR
ncbi:MAG: hypothetical protein SVU32_07720 [Candidatus Nanohaloarchaea archaeon]|nr:hypothetical protein [Candidatus Nanohaloarchaea archaeon]